MPNKGHNTKKPRLAGHHGGQAHDAVEALVSAGPQHKMSFAQHQHELEKEHTATPLPEAPALHLKSDAQQHQQKTFTHKGR